MSLVKRIRKADKGRIFEASLGVFLLLFTLVFLFTVALALIEFLPLVNAALSMLIIALAFSNSYVGWSLDMITGATSKARLKALEQDKAMHIARARQEAEFAEYLRGIDQMIEDSRERHRLSRERLGHDV